MNSTTFNTLAASKNLQKAGMNTELAEAVAMEIEAGQGNLSTKSDIHGLHSDIERARNDINWLKWVIGFHFAIHDRWLLGDSGCTDQVD